jgi:DNA-binding NtrC family response regulator
VEKGKFREDLYYRLNTVPIQVPSLRERPEDIHLLFRKFCVDFASRYRTTPIQLEDQAKELLTSYHWPGNVRELKNVAEQVSVLSTNKNVSREALFKFLPAAGQSKLPALAAESGDKNISDRELMYKLLFDMRQDINDLKRFIWTMAQGGKVDVPDYAPAPNYIPEPYKPVNDPSLPLVTADNNSLQQPVVVDHDAEYEEESVEENLSLSEMEKDMIVKALEKHRGRRRDAALGLGISERTLYRKIKEYDISA